MATAVSARPPAPLQKVKKPAPPALQTAPNGSSSQQSPSPSLANKRPPSGFAHPGSAGLANGTGTPNGATPRLSTRRKDSQKVAENAKGKARVGTGDVGQIDRRPAKKVIEPYVKTTSYILKKFRNRPASFTLHLHPSHFRFEEQDGSFSYDSPMRVLLEHIKDQTVPADMIEDFLAAGIKFYDNCLIVQIHDHRKTSSSARTSSSTADKDRNQPFSVHNYNKFITPSPFVPYPQAASQDDTGKNDASAQGQSQAKESSSTDGPQAEQNEMASEAANKGPKIFTTVLFSNPLTLQEEMMRYASIPDLRANTRKQSTMNARTPASAHPPTPSSAAPATGPPAKKQKMLYSSKAVQEIEAKIISSSAPALFLDPAKDFGESQSLLEKLADPLHQREPPAPKSKKRTVAELAADEALAAEEQRFMLIMDERLVPASGASAAGNTVGDDEEAGGATFAARFERFKTIEEIKETLQERKQRAEEAKAQQQQHQAQLKARHEQEQREAQARLQLEQKQREAAAHRKQQQQQQHEQQMRMAQQMQQQNAQAQNQQGQQTQQHLPTPNQHSHPPPASAAMSNGHAMAMAQGLHSSPAMRVATPHNTASPQVTAAMMANHGVSSVPMSVTNSNQGAGSPPRPGSAQHAHPQAGMGHLRQQPPSRHGTPAMPNGTPRIQQATPDMRNVTPTPRMSHASPVNGSVAATPVMGHAAPHMNGGHPLTQQQQMMLRQQMLQQHRPQSQGSPPNPHLAQQQMHQIAAHHAQQIAQQQQRPPGEAYHQALQQMQQQQQAAAVAAAAGGHGMPNGYPNGVHGPQPGGGNPAAAAATMAYANQQQQQQQQPAQLQQRYAALLHQSFMSHFEQLKQQFAQKFGHQQMPPHVVQQCKDRATQLAHQQMQNLKSQQMMRQHQIRQMAAQQQQKEALMAMQQHGGMNGMGGMQ